VTGPGSVQHGTCPVAGDAAFDEFVDAGVEDRVQSSSVVALSVISSKSACTFPALVTDPWVG